jgi:hypothetical protein
MGRPNKFDGMMYELIVGLAWDCRCFKNGKPVDITDFIPETGPVSADQFARWVIMAEGLDPDQKKYRRRIPQLKGVFVKHMGSEVVDASRLRAG